MFLSFTLMVVGHGRTWREYLIYQQKFEDKSHIAAGTPSIPLCKIVNCCVSYNWEPGRRIVAGVKNQFHPNSALVEGNRIMEIGDVIIISSFMHMREYPIIILRRRKVESKNWIAPVEKSSFNMDKWIYVAFSWWKSSSEVATLRVFLGLLEYPLLNGVIK